MRDAIRFQSKCFADSPSLIACEFEYGEHDRVFVYSTGCRSGLLSPEYGRSGVDESEIGWESS